MTYDIIHREMSNEKYKGKDYDTLIKIFTKGLEPEIEFDFKVFNDTTAGLIDEYNENVDNEEELEWTDRKGVSEEERERRHKLYKSVNDKLIKKAACKLATPCVPTVERYPMDNMMHHINPPDKTTLTVEEQNENQKITDCFKFPKEHTSELIQLHLKLMQKIESDYDAIMQKKMDDEELVKNAEAIVEVGNVLSGIQDMKRILEKAGIYDTDGKIASEITYTNKNGQPVTKPMTEEDKLYLMDFQRLCDKYEAGSNRIADMSTQIGIIQNPYYEIMDLRSLSNNELYRLNDLYNELYRVSGVNSPGEKIKNGAIRDTIYAGAKGVLASYFATNLQASYNYHLIGETNLIENYFKEFGVKPENLKVRFNGDESEQNYQEVDLTERKGGYAQIYPENQPENSLVFQCDGEAHLTMQLGGAEEPEKEQPQPEDIEFIKNFKKPKVVPKPGLFKRIFNKLFGAFKEDFARYDDYKLAEENYRKDQTKYESALKRISGKNMASYKQTVEDKDKKAKQVIDEKLADIKKRGKKIPAGMVEIKGTIKATIEMLAQGDTAIGGGGALAQLMTCAKFGDSLYVTEDEFNKEYENNMNKIGKNRDLFSVMKQAKKLADEELSVRSDNPLPDNILNGLAEMSKEPEKNGMTLTQPPRKTAKKDTVAAKG